MAPRRGPSPMAGWPGPEFTVRATFRAPLKFVYDWCTDYSARDAKLEGERYERRVIERGRRRVVIEDLEDTPNGWDWFRSVITLQPPNGWDLTGRGNRSEVAGRYDLVERPDGRVQLDIRWRRRDLVRPARRTPKAERERRSTVAWQRFTRALERDYRASLRSRRP